MKIRNLFRTPTADEIARNDLAETQRQLLQHRSNHEYHEAMVACLTKRLERLDRHVNGYAERGDRPSPSIPRKVA